MDILSIQTAIANIVDRWVQQSSDASDTDLRDQLLQLFVERWMVIVLEHVPVSQRPAIAQLIDQDDMIAVEQAIHAQLSTTALVASLHQTEHELQGELFSSE